MTRGDSVRYRRLVQVLIRHRVAIADLSVLAAAIAAVAYVAFEIDIFVTQGAVSRARETVELDESLLLGALTTLGLLVFGARRHFAQRRELRRRIAAEQHVRVLAYQDPLTGLPNRRQLEDALNEVVQSPPAAGGAHALLLLDLNGFKRVNDVHGHDIGDEVLIVVAQRLRAATRDDDLVARLGGDEFAVLARHVTGPDDAAVIGQRIVDALNAPVVTGGVQHAVGTAIGIALIPHDAPTIEEALRKADVALYRAKAARRSAVRFFEPEMDRTVHERARIEGRLRAAVLANRITTSFLPQVDLKSGALVAFEAGPRWHDSELGDVAAERFVPIAEDVGLIHDIAAQLLLQACTTAVQWPAHIQLSCDLYPGQLNDPDLATRIAGILAQTGLAPQRLELEITEAAIVRDIGAARTAFSALRDIGVKIALDNFGTGYSSLYHLRSIKLDKIKIDSRFVTAMTSESESADIVRALVGLGHGLGLEVSAQGIVSDAQQASLIGSGVDQGQGRLYSRAIEGHETLALLAA